jgi:hypothetical protein
MLERIAVGCLLILATALVFWPPANRWLSHPRAATALLWAFVISRMAGWFGCYVMIPGLVRHSDLVKYYYPEAVHVLEGQIPYADFASSYGPLFPYIAGALLPVWNHLAAVALPMVLFEIVAVILLCRFARAARAANQSEISDAQLAQVLFLYTLSPAALYWTGMIAYNSSIVLFFWVVSVGLLYRRHFGSSLAALSGSVLAGKALGLLVAPLWIADPRRRLTTIAAAAALAIAAFFIARYFGINLLMPLLLEGERSTSGNVWFLLSGAFTFSPASTIWTFAPLATFVLAVGALTASLWSRWKQTPSLAQFCAAIAAVGWLFMLLSKKTYPHYTPMFVLFCVFALCTARPRGFWIVALAVTGAIGIVEPGLWNALGQPTLLSEACKSGCNPADYYALIGCDMALVSLESYLLANCIRAAIGPAR